MKIRMHPNISLHGDQAKKRLSPVSMIVTDTSNKPAIEL